MFVSMNSFSNSKLEPIITENVIAIANSSRKNDYKNKTVAEIVKEICSLTDSSYAVGGMV